MIAFVSRRVYRFRLVGNFNSWGEIGGYCCSRWMEGGDGRGELISRAVNVGWNLWFPRFWGFAVLNYVCGCDTLVLDGSYAILSG